MAIRTRVRQLLALYFEEPGARLLHAGRLTPNIVTALGLLVSGVAAYLAAVGALLPAGVVLLVAGAFDMLDGALARLSNRVSSFGAILDSVVDRLAEAFLLFGLLLFYLDNGDKIGIALVFLVLIASYMVSYIRARGEGIGVAMQEAGLVTRAERVVVMVFGLISGMAAGVTVALLIVLVFSVFTSGQRLYHVWSHTKEQPGM